MNFSPLQKVMYKLILDPDSNIKLSDFYDDSVDELLEEKMSSNPNYSNISCKVTIVDIVKVAYYLICIEKCLTPKEIEYFSCYLCSNYKPNLKNDLDFIIASEKIINEINIEINRLSSKINRAKNQDNLNKDIKKMEHKKELATDLELNRKYLKMSISELDKVKINLSFIPKKNINKKFLKQKKQLKMEDKYIAEENEKTDIRRVLNKLSNMIDNTSIKENVIYEETIKTINLYDLSQSYYRNDIKNIIKKLKDRLKDDDTNYREIKKNIDEFEKEYNYDILTDAEIEALKQQKRELKDSLALLNKLDDEIELTTEEYKKTMREQVVINRNDNKRNTMTNIQSFKEKKYYMDTELGDHDFFNGLGAYSELQPNIINGNLHNMFSNYKAVSDVKEMFCIANNEYVKDSNKNNHYAFSIDYDGTNTIIRMHVLNEFPYISRPVKGFMVDYFYKTLIKEKDPETGQLKLKYTLDNETNGKLIDAVSIKKDKLYPTIAYSFTFDCNYHLTKFNIEKCDGILHDCTLDEKTVLANIYDMNNKDNKHASLKMFFEHILLSEFIKYAKKNKLPIIYYGKYNDESQGNINEGQYLGSQKLEFEERSRINDLLKNNDSRSFDKVMFLWFKNYRLKHFSLRHRDDFTYTMKDVGLINPESFMGYNVQRVINKCVFSNITEGIPVYDELVNSQKKYIDQFNKARCYLNLDDFIKSIGEEDINQRGSR